MFKKWVVLTSHSYDQSHNALYPSWLFPSHINPRARDLILALLHPDPLLRLGACDALKHDWICNDNNYVVDRPRESTSLNYRLNLSDENVNINVDERIVSGHRSISPPKGSGDDKSVTTSQHSLLSRKNSFDIHRNTIGEVTQPHPVNLSATGSGVTTSIVDNAAVQLHSVNEDEVLLEGGRMDSDDCLHSTFLADDRTNAELLQCYDDGGMEMGTETFATIQAVPFQNTLSQEGKDHYQRREKEIAEGVMNAWQKNT